MRHLCAREWRRLGGEKRRGTLRQATRSSALAARMEPDGSSAEDLRRRRRTGRHAQVPGRRVARASARHGEVKIRESSPSDRPRAVPSGACGRRGGSARAHTGPGRRERCQREGSSAHHLTAERERDAGSGQAVGARARREGRGDDIFEGSWTDGSDKVRRCGETGACRGPGVHDAVLSRR
ncbi:hypothetical protein C8Q80DRAFT_117703 [Daedaleopsis nitida]|nr:hypothetical protein C8Q80DRAFT_117703 [Daedaleopsis nitida]